MSEPVLLLAQLLPIDPQVAIEITKQLSEQFQTRFIAMTITIFVLQNVAWTVMHWRLVAKMNAIQEARVQDHKEGERRAEKTMDRMALHMDRAAEAVNAASAIILDRAPRRRPSRGEVPIVADPRKLPEES